MKIKRFLAVSLFSSCFCLGVLATAPKPAEAYSHMYQWYSSGGSNFLCGSQTCFNNCCSDDE